MPTHSTLRTLTLALAITIPCAQAIVVVPYVSYIGPSPIGVPNEFVRNPVNESGPDMPLYQGRIGVHLTIGTPPQHVWAPPHFFDSETYVRSASLCGGDDMEQPGQLEFCESDYSGIFAANESSTFNRSNEEPFGTDTVTFFDATPDLMNDGFKFGVLDTEEPNYVGELWGTLGLGSNSTFLQTFFPGKEQIGIYATGGNSTFGKPPPSYPPRPLVVYELELGGYNESHFTGEKFTQSIGPPSPFSNSSNPFTLNVTGISVGSNDILGGEPFLATVDLAGRISNILPTAVYDAFVDVTGGKIRSGLPTYNHSSLPTNPADQYNLTMTFSNGYSVSFPQEFLFSYMPTREPDFAQANILRVGDPGLSSRSWSGPVIALNQLMWSSYIGIDHAAGEWWLAKAVHPWDEPESTNTNTTNPEPKTGAAAGGIGDNLKKALVSAAALAAAVALFC
ncbi:hypothetical protein TWF281_002699 [Arthrobotrys megalospora]